MPKIKVPPHSNEGEQSILGSMLIAPDSWDVVREIISPIDFYFAAHRLIYESCLALLNADIPIDMVSLSENLEERGFLERAGGFTYIGDLMRNTPSASNVAYYCNLVRERSIRRQLILEAEKISDESFHNLQTDVKKLFSGFEQSLLGVGDRFLSEKRDASPMGLLSRYNSHMEEVLNRKGNLAGISSGFVDLDKKLSGLKKSDFIVLAARPSMGKTTLALNIIQSEMIAGGYPLVFSLEMPEEQIMSKLIASLGNVSIGRIQSPNDPQFGLSDQHWAKIMNAQSTIAKSKLMIDDRSALTVTDIEITCNRYKKMYSSFPSVIMIDYLQLLVGDNKENRTQEISGISRSIKTLAKKIKCPIIVLSQLNRNLENRTDKRPVNSDLRESGQIEQDADSILFIYRDEVYNENSVNKGLAEIIIGKNRCGEIGKVGLEFDGALSRFSDMRNRVIQDEPEPQNDRDW